MYIFLSPVSLIIDKSIEEAEDWVTSSLLTPSSQESNLQNYSWASFHSSKNRMPPGLPALCGMLPLFHEKSSTPSMIMHGMNIIKQTTAFLNPGQIPIITVDQPLYALVKKIQYEYPNIFREDKFVAQMGGLHIEMALWSCLGTLLAASGWTTALVSAKVSSSGTAESYLNCAHLMRTRLAHQVTFAALKKLQVEAFQLIEGPSSELNFDEWRQSMIENCSTFMY